MLSKTIHNNKTTCIHLRVGLYKLKIVVQRMQMLKNKNVRNK